MWAEKLGQSNHDLETLNEAVEGKKYFVYNDGCQNGNLVDPLQVSGADVPASRSTKEAIAVNLTVKDSSKSQKKCNICKYIFNCYKIVTHYVPIP